jgi:hypothetical protein
MMNSRVWTKTRPGAKLFIAVRGNLKTAMRHKTENPQRQRMPCTISVVLILRKTRNVTARQRVEHNALKIITVLNPYRTTASLVTKPPTILHSLFAGTPALTMFSALLRKDRTLSISNL